MRHEYKFKLSNDIFYIENKKQTNLKLTEKLNCILFDYYYLCSKSNINKFVSLKYF